MAPGGDIVTGLMPPLIPGEESFDPYPAGADNQGDSTKAKDELTRCGPPSGFSTNFADRAERPKEKATAEGLQQSLAKVGIKVTVEPFPQDLPGRARRSWPRAPSAGPPMPPPWTLPPSGLQDEAGLTYVFIAHDLSVVRHISDQLAVIHLGKIVEIADRAALCEHPMHRYTHALLSAVPVPDPTRAHKRERIPLTGDVPSPLDPPPACRFHTRCWKAQDSCKQIEPPLLQLAPGQQVACDVLEERVIV